MKRNERTRLTREGLDALVVHVSAVRTVEYAARSTTSFGYERRGRSTRGVPIGRWC